MFLNCAATLVFCHLCYWGKMQMSDVKEFRVCRNGVTNTMQIAQPSWNTAYIPDIVC